MIEDVIKLGKEAFSLKRLLLVGMTFKLGFRGKEGYSEIIVILDR